MSNVLTASVISLASFYFWSGLSVRICVKWPDYGIRRQNDCFVDLKKSLNSQVLLYEDALTYCRENGGFVNNSALNSADLAVLKRAGDNFSRVNAIPRLSVRRSRAAGKVCSRSLTTRPGCTVICAFKTCPVGTFGFPECQPCRCEHADRCDIRTGLCMETKCSPGFFGPPACRKCNCDLGTRCDGDTGECPFGCREGWSGKSCLERGCRGGKCSRAIHSDDENCTSGSNCTQRTCPQGTYNPPSCNETCYCLYAEFCDEVDGDCGGTPCTGRRTGRKCEDVDCLPMHFGVPDCSSLCFCKDSQPCHTTKGLCSDGCRQGWSGENCNQRLCPERKFGYPACILECNCRIQKTCNSLSGVCEVYGCADGRQSGINCTIPVPPAREGVVSSVYSTAGAAALVLGTSVVILAVCVQSMTHQPDPLHSRRSTMATSGDPSSDTSSSVTAHRKSRVSYIQMDNRHMSLSYREPFNISSTLATDGFSTSNASTFPKSNAPALYPSTCVDTSEVTNG